MYTIYILVLGLQASRRAGLGSKYASAIYKVSCTACTATNNNFQLISITMASATFPVIKKRVRPQARVREISAEKEDEIPQPEGEEESLGYVHPSRL